MTPLRITASLGALGVALGAFGSHGLRSVLEANHSIQTWHTASFYHLLHTAVLLWISTQSPFRKRAFSLFVLGITLFSGSLYALSILQTRWLGMLTPFGGVCIILGWLTLLHRPISNEK